jgi:hypothetical protein
MNQPGQDAELRPLFDDAGWLICPRCDEHLNPGIFTGKQDEEIKRLRSQVQDLTAKLESLQRLKDATYADFLLRGQQVKDLEARVAEKVCANQSVCEQWEKEARDFPKLKGELETANAMKDCAMAWLKELRQVVIALVNDRKLGDMAQSTLEKTGTLLDLYPESQSMLGRLKKAERERDEWKERYEIKAKGYAMAEKDCAAQAEESRRMREALTLDCGDHSCQFALKKSGQRTNGGCRCLRYKEQELSERFKKVLTTPPTRYEAIAGAMREVAKTSESYIDWNEYSNYNKPVGGHYCTLPDPCRFCERVEYWKSIPRDQLGGYGSRLYNEWVDAKKRLAQAEEGENE